jgi:hypothetical protein
MEAMLDVGRDEDDRAGLDGAIFRADANRSAAVEHVVNLVFYMRLLRIDAAGGERVDAEAHGGNAEEFEIGAANAPALGEEFRDFEGPHVLIS